MLAVLVVSACAAAAEPAAPPKTPVRVAPIRTTVTALAGAAALVTELVVGELRKDPSLQVVSQREVDATLQQEKEQRVAGVESSTAAAGEAGRFVAGVLVSGELAPLGDSGVFTLTAVRVNDGSVLGRSTRQFLLSDEGALLRLVPTMVAEVMGRPVTSDAAPAPDVAPPLVEPAPPGGGPRPPRVLAGVGTVVAIGVGGVSVAGLAALLGAGAVDAGWRSQQGIHLFPWSALVVGTAGAVVAGAVLAVAGTVAAACGIAWGVSSWR